MKKNKISVVMFFSLLFLVPMLLFAAGGQESSKEASGDVMELTICYDYKMPDDSPIKKEIEEHFNVKLNCLSNDAPTTPESRQKLQLMVASGEKMDAFPVYDYNMLKKFAEQGVIAEVPVELIKENAPRMYAYVNKVDPNAWAFTNVNGKNYGFPTAWPLGSHSRTMSIRSDWLENLGMEIPKTLDDLEEALYAFRNEDPDGNGQKDTYGLSFYKTSGDITMFAAIYGAFGVHPQQFQVRDGELVYGSILPEVKEPLALLNKWYKDEVIDPSFFVDNYNLFQEKWTNGKFGLIPDTWWWTAGPSEKYYSGKLYDPLVDANPDAKPTTIAPPVGPYGDQGMRQRSVMEVIPMIVFGKHLEDNPAKIEKWFQIWDETQNTEKWSVMIYHGHEGVTYRWNDAGMPEWIPPYDTWEKREEYGMNYFSWVPNYDVYDTATKDGEWIKKERSKAIGPMDAISNYPLEAWTEYKVNLNTIEEKAYIGFITGQKPLDEFDDFVQEWLDNGGEEVLAEARKVYEEKFK